MQHWRRVLIAAAMLAATPARPAAGQLLPAGPIETANGTVTVAGDAAVTVGSRDESAFFNFTNYEHNTLRMLRLSLSAMWQPGPRFAILSEFRSEDGDGVKVYALYARVRPWKGHALDLQAGRIPPVFGAFARRAYGPDNPLIGYPLAYQYLTSLRPDAIPASADDLLAMRARGWRATYPVGVAAAAPGVPVVNADNWDTGVEGHWTTGRVDTAVAVTTGTLSDPRVRDDNGAPEISGRVGWTPATGLVLGASASRGEFLSRQIEDVYAGVLGAHPYVQQAIGLDAEYSRGYWLVQGEALGSWWNLPKLNQPVIDAPLGAASAYIETRYRFLTRYFAAVRLDHLTFSKIAGQRFFPGVPTPWDAPVTRLEGGGGVYLQRNVTFRVDVQGNWRGGGRVHDRTFVSGQLACWF